MKFSSTSITLALLTLAATSLAKECTPSFDYCGSKLLHSKGFTETDLKGSLKDTEYADKDPKDIVFHCKNPGIVGHPKYCPHGCKEAEADGNGDGC